MRRKLKTLGKRAVVLMLCMVIALGETGGIETVHATRTMAVDADGVPLSGDEDGVAAQTENVGGARTADNNADGAPGAGEDAGNLPDGGANDMTAPSGSKDDTTNPSGGGTDGVENPSNGGAETVENTKPGTENKTDSSGIGTGTSTDPSGDGSGKTSDDGSDPVVDSSENDSAIENDKEKDTVSDNDPLDEELVDPEEDIKNSDIFDKFQDGSLEDLMDVDEDSVTAAMTWTDPEAGGARGMRKARGRAASNGWSAAAYYVGRRNGTDVVETDDFSVKYQIEFHADTKIPEGGVKFRVPAFLLTERDGETKHYADDIAVPEAVEKTNPDGSVYYEGVSAKTISFNYYKETVGGKEYYVFFNYQDLPKGTNAAFQVLYRKMDVIYLEDGTTWNLPITVEVKTSDSAETVKEDLATLTGRVDTKAELESVTKEPYFSPGSTNYTPGLYTKRQIDEFITSTDYTGTNLTKAYEKTVKNNFDDYFYSVWAVKLTTKATQGYFVDIKEKLPEGAMIIGVSAVNQPNIRLKFQDSPDCNEEYPDRFRVYAEAVGYEWKEQTKDNEDKGSVYQLMREADYRTIRIVVAYPKELLEEGAEGGFEQTASTGGYDAWNVTNDLTAIVTGVDRKDEPTGVDFDGSSFTYREYKWTPPSTPGISSSKSNAEGGIYSMFNGWNNIYMESVKAKKDRGDFTFTTNASMQDYAFTHDVKAKDVPAKEGENGETYYSRFTVSDDLLYLSKTQDGMGYQFNQANNGDEGENHVLLTGKDYYFSGVTINLKDYGFDTTEDVKIDAEKDPTYMWRSTRVYAMFADTDAARSAYGSPDAQGWYLVSEKVNGENGYTDKDGYSSVYNFADLASDPLSMKPYRVKVEQESNAHTISATVKATVKFRYDSPVLNDKTAGSLGEQFQALEKGITLENNVGLIRERVTVAEDGSADYEQYGTGWGDIRDRNRVHRDEKALNLYAGGVSPERYRDWETSDAYGRNNTQGFAYLNPAIPRSKSFKYGTITNDPVHERVNQRYNLVVYNGYSIYDESVVSYMKAAAADLDEEHTISPGQKEVVFYDLLPLGMTFDPSQEIVAGRIDSLDERLIQREPASWQRENVVVTVDKDDDVIENWHGTKRTLVRFHVKYDSEADPSVYRTYKDNRMWMAGWGLSFGCYYQWRDEDIAQGAENIFAFSTEEGVAKELIGSKSGEYMVCKDNGELPANGSSYRLLVQDENGNAVGGNFRGDDKELKSVIYGRGTSESEFSRSSEAKIRKRVRAEDDRFGEFPDATDVGVGLPYTYEVTVSVTQGKVKNLVVYDSIEQATEDLSGGDQEKIAHNDLIFDDNYWYGIFEGVDTSELEMKKIDAKDPGKRIVPVVYYSADRDAAQDARKTGKSFEEIRQENPDVWVEASKWNGDLSEVKSVAVDIRYTNRAGADGKPAEFVLENMDAVSFKIRMRAPAIFQEDPEKDPGGASRKDAETGATWAYNNSICSSTNADMGEDGEYTEWSPQFSTSDATRLRLRDSEKIYIEKQFKDASAVPDAYKDTSFAIKVEQTLDPKTSEDGKEDISQYTAYANQPYVLYEKNADGEWVQVDQILHATDVKGCVYLKAGQRAELIVSDKAEYKVTEVENPFWKPEYKMETETKPVLDESGNPEVDEDGQPKMTSEDHYTVSNEYRPVVYAQKTVIGCPTEIKNDKEHPLIFHFKLEVKPNGAEDFEPVSDQEYWVVDSAYGDNPTKLASGIIGENGEFTIRPGQIVALFPGELGTQYRITEDLSGDYGKDWAIFTEGGDVAEGTLGLTVNRETFSNLYRWRDLEITKEITHQDAEDCEQPFTFVVERVAESEEETVSPGDPSSDVSEREPLSGKTWELYDQDGKACLDKNGNPITGELDKDGKFTAACAGKTVKIKGLEARASYLVKEVTAEDGTSADEKGNGTEYRPLVAEQMANMSVYSQTRELIFTNDYLLRPISVSKTVAYAGQKTQAELNALRDREFTMTICVEERKEGEEEGTYKLYKNQPFTRSGVSSNAVLPDETDKDGRFTIRDGETVTFENVGREGLNYKIEEVQDAEYKQIYPVPVNGEPVPAEDAIEREGSKVVFINGTDGLLMLGKEYTADPEDAAGNAYLNKIKEDSALRAERAVTMKLEVKDAEGEWVPFTPEDEAETVTIIDTLGSAGTPETGEGSGTGNDPDTGNASDTGNTSEAKTWGEFIGADGTFQIDPWKRVVVPMTGRTKTEYRVSESWEDCSDLMLMKDCGLEGFQSGYMAVEAENPEMTGVVESKPVATIANHISGINPASTVGKAMLGGSEKVPTGAALVFQVQRFTGAAWEPAKDVRYIVTDYDPTVAADRQQETIASGFGSVATTGADGKITVYKCDDSTYSADERSTGRFPKISFVTEVVCPEGKTTGAAGEYRLVELISESSEKWGNWYNCTWDDTKSEGTIVNSNRPLKVKIAKQLEDDVIDDGTMFSFTLKQVMQLKEGVTTPSSKNDIITDKAAKGITYNVFDENGNFVKQKVTNGAGEIKMKAGQYAELNVSDSTLWTVTENQDRQMKLTMMETEKNASTLGANLALINAKAGRVPAYIRAETDDYYVEYDVYGKIKNEFTVTLYWSDGTSDVLTFKEGEDTDTTGKYTMTTQENEDGSVRCRFESAEYSELFDTLTLRKHADGEVKEFDYTGGVQTYVVPSDGVYQIKLWGANGGNDASGIGGRGGYVIGSVHLKADQQLSVYVGGAGLSAATGRGGGYNGGGNAGTAGSSGGGGGATSISLVLGTWNDITVLENRIMVAGGGAGAGNGPHGGAAGGLEGFSGVGNPGGSGGKQDKAGEGNANGSFGVGGNRLGDGGGGGGGWYGGGAGRADNGGGGGSSFINGFDGCAIINDDFVFFDARMIDGKSVMPAPKSDAEETGHTGNGYARIRRIK